MKRWWVTVVKDYLTFSKGEKVGILVGVLIIVVLVIVVPRLVTTPSTPNDVAAFRQQMEQLHITIDTVTNYRDYPQRTYTSKSYTPQYTSSNQNAAGKAHLFEFDPNTLDEQGWLKLGVRQRTVETIIKFRAKGFTFRQPADIQKIYGLSHEQATRLQPYVRIARQPMADVKPTAPIEEKPAPATRKIITIDINQADTTQLLPLPGIGSKLASRIVSFRNKLGGFTSVDQVGETYGLPDSTLQKIKPYLVIGRGVQQLNINTADVKTLQSHPYIKWNIANAIVAYRNQHGGFTSLHDLKKIDIVSNDLFNRLLPYLAL